MYIKKTVTKCGNTGHITGLKKYIGQEVMVICEPKKVKEIIFKA